MLIYISGRIKNNDNYREDFKNAEQWLKLNGYRPINTVAIGDSMPQLTYEQYMQLDYRLIDIADGIYMLTGWQKSKGAKAELAYAKSLKKKIYYQSYYKGFKSTGTEQ